MKKLNIAFICVHNSCRSQMAEAITRHLYNDMFNVFSAGTHKKDKINQDAVKTISSIYAVDMNESQYPKTLNELPDVDIVITMGCGVECPFLKSSYVEDWGLDDPTGKPLDAYIETAKQIEEKLLSITHKIKTHLITI